MCSPTIHADNKLIVTIVQFLSMASSLYLQAETGHTIAPDILSILEISEPWKYHLKYAFVCPTSPRSFRLPPSSKKEGGKATLSSWVRPRNQAQA